MADFVFDGKKLKNAASGYKVGEVDRDVVRAANASHMGEIQGKVIRDAHGKKVLEFDGKNVKDDRGKKVITINEIKELIDSDEDGIALVAMWYFFIKK